MGIVWPFLFLNLSLFAQEVSISEIVEKASPSVIRIITYDITGAGRGEGSGFFIAPGKILTNAHVLGKAYSAEIFSGIEYYIKIKILKLDKEIDLALLEVDIRNEIPLSLEKKQEIRPGQRILTIGNPMGLEKTVSDGLISAVRGVPGVLQLIQISAPISPGSSGGPLLNLNGNVIGVTSAMIKEGQNINFAIGIETINNFLNCPDKPQYLLPAKSRILWRAILKRVTNVAVGLVALVFSGAAWWIIFPIFIIVSIFVWIFKWAINTVKKLIRKKSKKGKNTYELEKESEKLEQYNEHEAYHEDEAVSLKEGKNNFIFHCWKCGEEIEVDLDNSSKTTECWNCGTVLLIPRE
jgi:ribosomal protein S27E